MSRWPARALVPLLCLALIAFGGGLTMKAAAGTAAQAGSLKQDPAALYQSYCSVCHGDHGNGLSRARASLNPPPSDFTHPATKAILSRERMMQSVREGRPGTAMIGWKAQLSDAQIAGIVDYVREKFMSLGKRPTPNEIAHLPASAPIQAAAGSRVAATTSNAMAAQKALKGDMLAGRQLYEQNCVACHGKGGDGNGPRAYFITPRPRSFISAESRTAFNKTALIHSIAQGKRGTEMPSWEKVLSNQQIADVAEFVFRRFLAGDGGGGQPEKQ